MADNDRVAVRKSRSKGREWALTAEAELEELKKVKPDWPKDYQTALSRWEELWLISEQVSAVVRAAGCHATLTSRQQCSD